MHQIVLMIVGPDDDRVPTHKLFASVPVTSAREVVNALAQATSVADEATREGEGLDDLEEIIARAWSD